MHVVIVGGSLIGLMHGIMLKHHGCEVDIFEQSTQRFEGQAAGVMASAYTIDFLSRHDRIGSKLVDVVTGTQTLDTLGRVTEKLRTRMGTMTWDALYFRLRVNFDGHRSSFERKVPASCRCDGIARYHTGRRVLSIGSEVDGSVRIEYEDSTTRTISTVTADLVIGADGANSTVRKLLCPDSLGRKYAGYVLWRGIVPRSNLSTETVKQCHTWFSFCPIPQQRDYVVIYPITGRNGTLESEDREFNFAWYSQISSEDLKAALASVDGHRHKWSVPQGKLDPTVWQKQLRDRGTALNPACTEIAAQIERPFLQVVGDYTAPQASFLDGHVLLVGDALVTLQPHTGFGVSSGACHALQLEDTLFGSSSKSNGDQKTYLRRWERAVFEYSHMERLRSISWGEYYMGSWFTWLLAAANYHGRVFMRFCYNWVVDYLWWIACVGSK